MEVFSDEYRRCRNAISRRLSEKQIAALRLIADKKVRVGWGMLTEKPCPVTDGTLWSLELRGLAKQKGAPGIVCLTAAGKQILELIDGS